MRERLWTKVIVLLRRNEDFNDAERTPVRLVPVAEFGMLLRGSRHRGTSDFAAAIERARTFRGPDSEGYRLEFIKLAEVARSLHGIETAGRSQR